jgi:hypothetical protein
MHREIQAVDPDALSDDELAAYLRRCGEHHAAMITQHLRFGRCSSSVGFAVLRGDRRAPDQDQRPWWLRARRPTVLERMETVDGKTQDDQPELEDHPKHHRARRIVLAATAVLVIAAIVVLPLLLREGAEPVSLSDASRRFRLAHPGVPESALPLVPAEGVYEYRGKGLDTLSILSLEQQQGPVMPATVSHEGHGCWVLRIDYSDKHWQRWRYCVSGEQLDEAGGKTWQKWDLGVTSIANLTASTCRSPILRTAMQPGDTWPQRCDITNDEVSGDTVSSGTSRYVGTEDVKVDGTTVPAYHVVEHRTLSGAQNGTDLIHIWFAPNGLPVRQRQTLEVASPSPVGDVTYHQTSDLRLHSLRPKR